MGLFDNIQEILISFLIWIMRLIYSAADYVYQIFLSICSARIFTNETVSLFFKRVMLIVGIVTLFVVAFVIIKSIVNPDEAIKNTSNIFIKIITSIVMLALVNTAFNYMYDLQKAVLGGNVIGKIILGGDDLNLRDGAGNEITALETLSGAGFTMSLDVFSAFFEDTAGTGSAYTEDIDEYGCCIIERETAKNYNDNKLTSCDPGDGVIGWYHEDDNAQELTSDRVCAYKITPNQGFFTKIFKIIGSGIGFASRIYGALFGGIIVKVISIFDIVDIGDIINNVIDYLSGREFYTLGDAYLHAATTRSFSVYNNFAPHIARGAIELHWFTGIIAGIYLVYILFSFAIDMAVRCAKLAFFQIIAPVPILTRIIPGKETIFNNWLKSTISTFAEVFIKIAVVFFGVYLITILPDASIWASKEELFDTTFVSDASLGVVTFARVLIILGILTFIKQAPKLISTMFGLESLSFKGIKDKLSEAAFVGKPIRKGIDAVEGGVSGALGGGLVGLRNGDFKKGLRSGFLAGTAGGGRQFKKQKDKLYHSYNPHDYKGSPGIFGGQSFASKMQEEAGKTNKSIKNDAILNNDKVIAAWKKQAEYMTLENTVRSKIMNALENEVRLRENQIQPEIDNLNANINNFEGSEMFRNFMNDPDVIRRANDMAANQLERGYITPEQFDATRTNYEKAYAREKIDSMKNDPIFAKNNPELMEYVENKRRHNELVSELQKVRNQLNDRDAINIKVDSEIERISKKYADGIKEDRDEIRKEYGSIVDENSDLFKAMSRQRATGKAEEEENMVKQYEKWTEAMSKISSGGGSAPTSGSSSSSLDKK